MIPNKTKVWTQIKDDEETNLDVLFFIAGRVGTLKNIYLKDFSLKVLSTSNEIVLNSVVPVRDLYWYIACAILQECLFFSDV